MIEHPTIKRTLIGLGLGLVAAFAAPALVSANARTAGPPVAGEDLATAVFAGGCFWCVEEAFDKVEGVVETTSGFTGGTVADPSYEQVTAGGTGHAEAVRVRYDPGEVTYSRLLDVFWTNVNPFDGGGQFCDRGDSYRSALFPVGEEQQRLAEASKEAVMQRFDKSVATGIEEAAPFYEAEAYHQDYHQKNPITYTYYKWRCGRAARLEDIWGKDPMGPTVALTEQDGETPSD
ncbi:MAG TPA: peptide-methionine (S)-S-oxide reductase MsrA [Arenibaculum sp.]|nr:peptide-methionine (S)-S-oxide reductase MsrA [Arenibaculum sp.]